MSKRMQIILSRADMMADLFRICNYIEDKKRRVHVFLSGMEIMKEHLPMPERKVKR